MILQGINTSLTWGQDGDRSCVVMVMEHSLLAISAAILYLVTTRSSEMVGRSSLIESSAVILELILFSLKYKIDFSLQFKQSEENKHSDFYRLQRKFPFDHSLQKLDFQSDIPCE